MNTFPVQYSYRLIFMTIIIVFIFYISVFNWTHLFRIKLYLNISNTKKNKPVYFCYFRSHDACRRSWLGYFYSRRSSRKYQPPLAMVNDNTDPNKSSISSIGLKNIHAKYITKTDKIVYKYIYERQLLKFYLATESGKPLDYRELLSRRVLPTLAIGDRNRRFGWKSCLLSLLVFHRISDIKRRFPNENFPQ